MIVQTSTKNTLYEQDYDLWLGETIKLLRNGDFNNIDIDNLIAELDNIGGSNKDALENNLIVILAHLLKWKYQPSHRSGSWQASIKEHRRRVNKALLKHPGLKTYLKDIFPKECYEAAREWAAVETGLILDSFPGECPFTIDEVLNFDFLLES